MESHEEVMEHEIMAKSQKILQTLPTNCTELVGFVATTKKLRIDVESWHFLTFSACKIDKRHCYG